MNLRSTVLRRCFSNLHDFFAYQAKNASLQLAENFSIVDTEERSLKPAVFLKGNSRSVFARNAGKRWESDRSVLGKNSGSDEICPCPLLSMSGKRIMEALYQSRKICSASILLTAEQAYYPFEDPPILLIGSVSACCTFFISPCFSVFVETF